MRFHDLRDTAATLMIRAGEYFRTVADILGHADPAMTLRRYAHVLPDTRERAAESIVPTSFKRTLDPRRSLPFPKTAYLSGIRSAAPAVVYSRGDFRVEE